MSAAHHKLNNLITIVDRNKVQIDGKTEEVMQLEPLVDKWKSFGWQILECDGHNHEEIISAINNASENKSQPSVIIANTLMGKGVKSIEDNYS